MEIWVDTADLIEIEKWIAHPHVTGVTTNPTLMLGQNPDDTDFDAEGWARLAINAAGGYPISIDGPPEVQTWGPYVYRKVPDYYREDGPWLNYTAVCTVNQIEQIADIDPDRTSIISVFAGRIMDTGRNPMPVIEAARMTGLRVLWASVREPFNIVQAEEAGCDIVTVPPAILEKWFAAHGKPLEVVAVETLYQFETDRKKVWGS